MANEPIPKVHKVPNFLAAPFKEVVNRLVDEVTKLKKLKLFPPGLGRITSTTSDTTLEFNTVRLSYEMVSSGDIKTAVLVGYIEA